MKIIMHCFINFSIVLIAFFFIHFAGANIFFSKALDVKLYEQYQKSFENFITSTPWCSTSGILFKKICVAHWSSVSKYFNEKEDATDIVQLHLVYALHLAANTTDNLADVAVAIYVKFRAFMQGLEYMNCTLIIDGYGSKSGYKLKKSCRKLSLHLFAFSKLGMEELYERIVAAGLDTDSANLIKDFIRRIRIFENEYKWVYTQELNSNDTPRWMSDYKHICETTAFYDVLIPRQTDWFKNNLVQMMAMFENMKLDHSHNEGGECYPDTSSPAPDRSPDQSLFTGYYIAKYIWMIAPILYTHCCKTKPKKIAKIVRSMTFCFSAENNSKKSKHSVSKTDRFNPFNIMYKYEVQYIAVQSDNIESLLDVKNRLESVEGNYAFRLNSETKKLELIQTL